MITKERAEEIIKREILDYHINDPDALLLLGDVYLEWATEKNPDVLKALHTLGIKDCTEKLGEIFTYLEK